MASKSAVLLKKILASNSVSSKSWYDLLESDQKADVDSIVRKFKSGKLPRNVSLTSICRAIKEEFRVETSVDSMTRYLREKTK